MDQSTIKRQNLEHLLQNTGRILDHHKKLTVAKGEHFNLFSVLDIETRENKTHSAFLAELINPKGSHLQGPVFLQLFLQVVNKELSKDQQKEKELIEKFTSDRTTVTPEFHIGNIIWEKNEGGRIDIFLKNGTNTICIENKIYAPDQKAQVKRYCGYNCNKNTVFYLTLKGEDPHEDSRGELESGEHFFNISYREHIVQWLELCLKEVPNLTSVREAINQYILLIKKLTNTLHMDQEKEMQKLMSTHLEESRYVARKYEKMIFGFQNKFREDVEERLKQELPDYEIQKSKRVDNKYSKLWIYKDEWKKDGFKYGLEPFSGKGHGNGFLFIGLFDKNNLDFIKEIPEEKKLNNWWRHTRTIYTEDKNEIKFQDLYSLEKLARPESEEYSNLINRIVEVTVEFIEDYEKKLPSKLIKDTETVEPTA